MRKSESAVLDFVGEEYSLEEDINYRLNIETVRDNFYLLLRRDRDIITLKFELRLRKTGDGYVS